MKKAFSVTIALLISLFIYLFYRCDRTVVNELAILLFSYDGYQIMKSNIGLAVPLHKLIINSLPGGLWIFCVTILAKDFYIKIRGHKIRVAILPVVFAVCLEFCQLIHLTNGTFDIADILCYLLFWFLAERSSRHEIPEQNMLSPFTLRGFICLACFLTVYLAHVNP